MSKKNKEQAKPEPPREYAYDDCPDCAMLQAEYFHEHWLRLDYGDDPQWDFCDQYLAALKILREAVKIRCPKHIETNGPTGIKTTWAGYGYASVPTLTVTG